MAIARPGVHIFIVGTRNPLCTCHADVQIAVASPYTWNPTLTDSRPISSRYSVNVRCLSSWSRVKRAVSSYCDRPSYGLPRVVVLFRAFFLAFCTIVSQMRSSRLINIELPHFFLNERFTDRIDENLSQQHALAAVACCQRLCQGCATRDATSMQTRYDGDSGTRRLLQLGYRQTLQRPLIWTSNCAICLGIMSPLTAITGIQACRYRLDYFHVSLP